MKEIKLTQGKVALVDDEDYEWLNQCKWLAQRNRNTYYARRYINRINGKENKIYMHREILNVPKGKEIDHQDHNGLNCQRSNIRIATNSQNGANRKASGKSKYLGVSFSIRRKRQYIRSQIKTNGGVIHLGICKTEEQAARRYDAAARFFHKEFANLNFK